jgi:hypothetical protein
MMHQRMKMPLITRIMQLMISNSVLRSSISERTYLSLKVILCMIIDNRAKEEKGEEIEREGTKEDKGLE